MDEKAFSLVAGVILGVAEFCRRLQPS